jgi:hypothetical protein
MFTHGATTVQYLLSILYAQIRKSENLTTLISVLPVKKRHLQTGKSQCLANPSVPLWLADEKPRIY